jgi:hypothetical protein
VLDPWYITGFADGEAAFTYSRAGGSYALYFAINQRADNRQVIEDIREYFSSVGDIYEGKESPPTAHSGFSKPHVYYRVTRVGELKVIVDHFDTYPLQSKKKHEAYKVWREMVMHKLENYRNIDYDTLHALAQKLSSLNVQSRAFKIHTR